MKKIFIALMTVFVVACTDVPPGNVGIVINKLGDDKGVENHVQPAGRYWLGWNESMVIFPTFTQTHVWTKDATEGSPNDESFTFQTREGMNVNTDLGISYSLKPENIPGIFQKYRKGIDEITNIVLRTKVRDAFIKAAASKPIDMVYGEGKAALILEVTDLVKANCDPIGITVEQLYWVGGLRLPSTIVDSINAKAQAVQTTAQREQEVIQVRFEADKRVAEAKGIADSTLLAATADAKAIEIKGNALAQNPLVIDFAKIEKWNGQLPSVVGTATPFINLK